MTGINTNQSYARFAARIGVLDTSSNSSGKLTVIADGVTVFDKEVSLSQSHDVNLPISGVQRLEIKAFPASGYIRYALGDPRLIPG